MEDALQVGTANAGPCTWSSAAALLATRVRQRLQRGALRGWTLSRSGSVDTASSLTQLQLVIMIKISQWHCVCVCQCACNRQGDM